MVDFVCELSVCVLAIEKQSFGLDALSAGEGFVLEDLDALPTTRLILAGLGH